MSLSYFPMYPDDFEADTAHLTFAEDGAYNRLLRLCWRTPGCSIPSDRAWIYRRMRAFSDDDKANVDVVLDEFFVTKGGRVSNARLMKEWLAASEAHEKRKNAGKKGGKAKSLKTNNSEPDNAVAMRKQPEPEPKEEKEITEDVISKNKRGCRLPDDWVPEPLDEAFIEKHNLTPEQLQNHFEAFTDYWKARPGAGGVKLDWQATWRNWIRNSRQGHSAPPKKSAQSNTLSILRKIIDDDNRNSEPTSQDHFDRLGFLASDKRD